MNSPAFNDPETVPASTETTSTTAAVEPTHATHTDRPDPITGEPNAHPVGVGVGALSAGAVGATIGAFAGPVGMVIGAAIGAIAGGLAGKEVAESPETTPVETKGTALDEFDHGHTAASTEELPLSASLAERTSPPDDAFFTSGTVSGQDPDQAATPLDDFDRSHPAAPATGAVPVARTAMAEAPLPTASSGLITPDESGFFADSTTGESSVLAESPLPVARAVSAESDEGDTATQTVSAMPPVIASGFVNNGEDNSTASDLPTSQSSYAGHLNKEHEIRTSAYYRYVEREKVGRSGSDLTDWIEAEKEASQR